MRALVCDFCSGPNPTHVAPCRDHHVMNDVGGVAHYSKGAWLACGPCTLMLRRGEREKLAIRAAIGFKRNADAGDLSNRQLLMAMRELHDRFWTHRDGAVREATEAELEQARREARLLNGVMPGPTPPQQPWVARVLR